MGEESRKEERKGEGDRKKTSDIPLSWTQQGLAVTPGKYKGFFPPSLEAGLIPSLPSMTLILGQCAYQLRQC